MYVELDFRNDTYAPYRKPNFQATYVNVQSNHPRYVINQVSISINKKLTTISKNESSFNRAKQHYHEALAKGGPSTIYNIMLVTIKRLKRRG